MLRSLLRPIKPFLDDPDVTELCINKAKEVVCKLNSTGKWSVIQVEELNDAYISDLINAMVSFNGKPVEQVMSLTLPDGERIQVTHGSAVFEGYYGFSIRKRVEVAFTLDELIEQGVFENVIDVSTNIYDEKQINQLLADKKISHAEFNLLMFKLNRNWRAFFIEAINTYKNIAASGKTGSGKTTFTRSLIDLIPIDERIVTIEDVHELKLERHINKTHLMYGKGAGRVSSAELLAAGMRLSPDRLLLAELRHDETWDYIQSLNTGHPGSITSTHANNANQTFDRIAGLLLQSPNGAKMPYQALIKTVRSAIDIVVFMRNRKVEEIFYDPIIPD